MTFMFCLEMPLKVCWLHATVGLSLPTEKTQSVNNPIYFIVNIVVSFCYFIVKYLLALSSDNFISIFVLHAFILKVFR